ncbi:unnamed protein product, partial [Prorocentrum cordatum]
EQAQAQTSMWACLDMLHHSGSNGIRSARAGSRHAEDNVPVPESGSVDDVTSDRTSNETEDRNSMETEAGGYSVAGNDTKTMDASSSGGSTGYQSSWPTRSGTQNSDEDSGWPRADESQQSKQLMTARMLEDLASSTTTAASAPTRKSTRVRRRHSRAKLETSASLEGGVHTLMLRQIPRHYTQLMFLADFSCRGFLGLVDFIYFQFDARKGKNVGYGFISATRHASAFLRQLDGACLGAEAPGQGQPLRIHPAAVQGYEQNFEHFAQTRVGAKSDPQFTPLFMPHGSFAGLPQDRGPEGADGPAALPGRAAAAGPSAGGAGRGAEASDQPVAPRGRRAGPARAVARAEDARAGAAMLLLAEPVPRRLRRGQRALRRGVSTAEGALVPGGAAARAAAPRGVAAHMPGVRRFHGWTSSLLLPLQRACAPAGRALAAGAAVPPSSRWPTPIQRGEMMSAYQLLEERKLNLLKDLSSPSCTRGSTRPS